MKRPMIVLTAMATVWAATPAGAEPILTLTPASGAQGSELVLTLSLLGTGECSGVNGKIRIPEGLSLELVTNGPLAEAAEGQFFAQAKVTTDGAGSRLAFLVSFRDGRGTVTAPGDLVSFHFAVAPDAPVGAFPVSFVDGSTAISNADGTGALPHSVEEAEVTIEPGAAGPDINRDGEVNAIDVQLVVNAVLGIPIGDLKADVTGDGQINAIDVQRVINTVLGIV